MSQPEPEKITLECMLRLHKLHGQVQAELEAIHNLIAGERVPLDEQTINLAGSHFASTLDTLSLEQDPSALD